MLRSLGMAKQAPAFTLKMSGSGVPWAGIVMTSVVYVFGAVLNALTPDAFEIALEAAAIGVLFTWGTIFLCQLRLRQLSDRGVIPPSTFQAPGSPYTSYIGLAFLVLVVIGMAISGWQSRRRTSGTRPTSWSSSSGSRSSSRSSRSAGGSCRPKVVANTGDRLKAVWADDGPTYGPRVAANPDAIDGGES